MGRVIKAAEVGKPPKKISPAAQEAAELLIAAQSAATQIRWDAKNKVIDLALTIARKIVGQATLLDPNLLDSIYSQAITAAGDLPSATLFVHPEDRPLSKVDDLVSSSGFAVVEDAAVGRAGCRIRAGGMEIDATLDAVLPYLETAMKGEERG